jgi:hypothetical protein
MKSIIKVWHFRSNSLSQCVRWSPGSVANSRSLMFVFIPSCAFSSYSTCTPEYEHMKFDWTPTAGGRQWEEPDGEQSLRALRMNTHAHTHSRMERVIVTRFRLQGKSEK